ncbi:hypothetical protein NDU88_005938 [Pleurodeles waltl]|uniref:Uncharacterized protein n=1 Tax=Pleurodeles waltl TaxID=8319 RepID=A0AAV7QIM1_PLEWA|nr:hypothetical protein NDU88_005938 [Pleurodeles waltl]
MYTLLLPSTCECLEKGNLRITALCLSYANPIYRVTTRRVGTFYLAEGPKHCFVIQDLHRSRNELSAVIQSWISTSPFPRTTLNPRCPKDTVRSVG